MSSIMNGILQWVPIINLLFLLWMWIFIIWRANVGRGVRSDMTELKRQLSTHLGAEAACQSRINAGGKCAKSHPVEGHADIFKDH